MNTFHTLTVKSIRRETPNAVSVTFEIPSEIKERFRFKAGQYITIKHLYNGTEIRRAYSICSTPSDAHITIGIKTVDGGSFSVYANTVLKAGDTLEVMPPQGKFVLTDATASQNYAAFAAGSGITPILSLVKSALSAHSENTFLLAFGNQSMETTMFHSELLQLLETYKDRFYVEFIYSRTQEDHGRFGRIERSTVNFLLKNKFSDTKFDAFYLCGPEPMIDEVEATLKQNGVNEKIIHHELFNTAEEGLLVESHDGNTTVTLTVDDETETFVMPQTKSILQAALDEGLDPPYSCQGGICSTCIARLTEGKAEMRKNQILTDGEIADGFILTCQAHPTTAKIVVDYDDV